MSTSSAPRVFITAGEPSGDAHAARLMQALRVLVPDIVFEGFGGPAMEMQGLHSLASIKDLAVSGFVEVAKRYRFFTQLLEQCQQHIVRTKPLAFIPVDYPGFNLRLAARVRSRHTPVVWYIAPQLWAWGRRRATTLASSVDRLMVVFPFEVEFFGQYGIRAEYVGHPLTETLRADVERRTGAPIVLMPGSRTQEVSRHVPLLVETIRGLRQSHGDMPFQVPRAPGMNSLLLRPLADVGADIVDDSAVAMDSAWAGLIKAGTSTLEATLRGLPYSTFYKTSTLSYHLSKHLIDVQSITLMNLLLQRNVVREYIQHEATPVNLAREIVTLATDLPRRAELIDEMHHVRTLLSSGGASNRAAEIVAETITRRFR